MTSAFHGIEVGKKSIYTHQQALYTTAHNITNMNTKGYTRQRVEMQTDRPLEAPSMNRDARPGQLGQGVEVAEIVRLRNRYIDAQIINEVDGKAYWEKVENYLYTVERIFNEPGEENIRNVLNQFWQSWEDLSQFPDSVAHRKEMIERGLTLTSRINHTYSMLHEVQEQADTEVVDIVNQINDITTAIAGLNEEIVAIESMGDNPNDLLDRRDLLVENLAQLGAVTVQERDPNEYMIYFQGMHVVQGIHAEALATVRNQQTGFHDIYYEAGTDSEPLNYTILQATPVEGGALKAVLEMRDGELQQRIDEINSLSINMTDVVNEIHADGFGLDGKTDRAFFSYVPNLDDTVAGGQIGDYDYSGNGTLDSTTLFKVRGSQSMTPEEQIGAAGQIILDTDENAASIWAVDYTATDTVQDVINRINSSDGDIKAYLDHYGRFVLKSMIASHKENNPDFTIRHLEDTGTFLSGTAGIITQGAVYDWRTQGQAGLLDPGADVTQTPMNNPAGWITVADTVRDNIYAIAAAGGTDYDGDGNPESMNGVGDNSNALKIAEALRQKHTMIETDQTFEEFIESQISQLGARAQQAKIEFETRDLLVQNLENIRQSISGVNLDEELANMVTYQHGYNAAARVITTFDRMLDTIINRMGV